MRTRARLARQRAGERSAGLEDARALVFELAGFAPIAPFDVMKARVVLLAGETAYRSVGAWIQQWLPQGWTRPAWSQVLVTDQRLLARLGSGELVSLWWGSLVGFDADLDAERVTLDYGDGSPRFLTGTAAPVVTVVGVARIYGAEALLTHPALEVLRT